ncbi:hypothetical protein V2J09_004170 [Rumex salicifolius]
MAGCAAQGGCPSDFIALSLSFIALFLLLARSIFPFLVYKVPFPKGSAFWLPAVQVFSSFNLMLSLVMSINLIRMKKGYWWQSCYIWSVWFEGPFGFGLLLSCRILQAFQLYFIFVKKRLPPIRSYVFLPLILLPWISGAAFIHLKKPLNNRCQMSAWWIIPIACVHSLYVAMLMGFTKAIQHVEFRFHELKDLWRGVLVSVLSVGITWRILEAPNTNRLLSSLYPSGIWVVAYVLNKTSLFVVSFFSISISQPLLSQMSLKKKEHPAIGTMGKALGIPESGVLLCREEVMNPDLFKTAVSELLQLMKMNLARDYWSSIYYMNLRDEAGMMTGHDLEQVTSLNVSSRLSSVHASDDPFHQENPNGSESSRRSDETPTSVL